MNWYCLHCNRKYSKKTNKCVHYKTNLHEVNKTIREMKNKFYQKEMRR